MNDSDSGDTRHNATAQPHSNYTLPEDEIDLREYVRVLIRRKKVILVVLLLCVILAFVASLFLPKLYEATAAIMIMPSKLQGVLSPTLMSLDVGKIDIEGTQLAERKPTMSIPTHQKLLKSSAVLERLAGKLDLATVNGGMPLERFFRQLKVESAADTSVLELVVLNEDPREAQQIAGTWADEYMAYSMELISGEIKGSRDFINEQFEEAQKNLLDIQRAIDAFDVNEQLELLQIELTEDRNQLQDHHRKISNLAFELQEKRNALKKMEADIAALTCDSEWIGSYRIDNNDLESFLDPNLSPEHRQLRDRALMAVAQLQDAQQQYDAFVNESQINLLRGRIIQLRADLLDDESLLSQLEQYRRATETRLNARDTWQWNMFAEAGGPIAERLSELTIWQILSLAQGHNFFESQLRPLQTSIEQQQAQLKTLEKRLFDAEQRQLTLADDLGRAQRAYDFYLNELKQAESEKKATESEIASVEFELAYSRQLAERLEGDVQTLKTTINAKELKLADLNRRLDMAKRSYETLAVKAEEAKIAKALELGEVKVVSKPYEPRYPVKPNRRVIVAGAAGAGLMLGILAAFIVEFWQKEDTVETPQ